MKPTLSLLSETMNHFTRRSFLKTAAFAAPALIGMLALQAAIAMAVPSTRKLVITKLVPILRRAGHEVFTPTLTGLGERAHLMSPAITLIWMPARTGASRSRRAISCGYCIRNCA